MSSRSLAPTAPGSRDALPWFVQQAESLRESGELAGAEELLARGLREHGATAPALAALAQVLEDRGDAERAEAVWRDALAHDEDYLPALRALADRAEAAGRRDEATDYYRRLIRLENAAFDLDSMAPPAPAAATLDAAAFAPVVRAEPEVARVAAPPGVDEPVDAARSIIDPQVDAVIKVPAEGDAAAPQVAAPDASLEGPSLAAAAESAPVAQAPAPVAEPVEARADAEAWDDSEPLAGFDLVLLDGPDDDLPALPRAHAAADALCTPLPGAPVRADDAVDAPDGADAADPVDAVDPEGVEALQDDGAAADRDVAGTGALAAAGATPEAVDADEAIAPAEFVGGDAAFSGAPAAAEVPALEPETADIARGDEEPATDRGIHDPAADEDGDGGAFGVFEVELEQPGAVAPDAAARVIAREAGSAAGEDADATVAAAPGAGDAAEPFGGTEAGLEEVRPAAAGSAAALGAVAEAGAPAIAGVADEEPAPRAAAESADIAETEAVLAAVPRPSVAGDEDGPIAAGGEPGAGALSPAVSLVDPVAAGLIRSTPDRPAYAWPTEPQASGAAGSAIDVASDARAVEEELPPPPPVWPEADAVRRAADTGAFPALSRPPGAAAADEEGDPFHRAADATESDARHAAVAGSGEAERAADGGFVPASTIPAAAPDLSSAAPAIPSPVPEGAPAAPDIASPAPEVASAAPDVASAAPDVVSAEPASAPEPVAEPAAAAAAAPAPVAPQPPARSAEDPAAPRRQVVKAAAGFDAAARGASSFPQPASAAVAAPSPAPAAAHAIADRDPWLPPPALTDAPSELHLADALVRAMEVDGDVMRAGSSVRRLLVLAMGRELGLDQARLDGLALAATLGGLGELFLGAGAGPRRTTGTALNLLSSVPMPREVVDALRHQHRRWDGGADPDGPRREWIPFAARLLAVVRDAAARITGPGRRGPHAAVAELQAGAGTVYDPVLVSVLRRVVARREHHGIGYGVGGCVLVAHPGRMRAMELAGRLHALGFEPRMVDARAAQALDAGAAVAVLAAAPLAQAQAAALAALRRDPATAALPILVVDADTAEVRLAGLSAGADLTFASSASFAEIQAALNALLRRVETLAPMP